MTRHQNAAEPQGQSTLYPYLRAYDREPIGRFLINRFNLSPPKAAITAGLVSIPLYFGVLWAFSHHLRGIPLPQHLIDVFRVAPNWDFYYPDLNALLFDITLNPLLIAILVFFCRYAKKKIAASFGNGLIVPKQSHSSLVRLVSKPYFLIGLPLLLALFTVANIYLTRQQYPGESALVRADILFLTGLAMYARASLLLYAVYTLLILREQKYEPKFEQSHCDQCGGWAPFRDLRNVLDFVLFFLAIYAATTMFTLSFPKNVHLLKDVLCVEALAYLFPLFPILLGWLFFQGVYAPHQEMRKLKAYPYKAHEESESEESEEIERATAQIFLNYAREDKEKVEELYQRLSGAGFKPWMDIKDILPGERWPSSIRRAIRDSDFFLVCLSTNSVKRRGWVQREMKQALDIWQEKLEDDIYLIPVRLEDCEVPESLREFQWVSLFEEDGCTRLVKAIHMGIERLDELINAEILNRLRERKALPEWPVKRNLRIRVLLASCIYLAVLALLLIKI